MIYTITWSPSIDYMMNLEADLIINKTNRAKNQQFTLGGKGINVSMVLNELAAESTIVTYLGGFTGEYIAGEIQNSDVPYHIIPTDTPTRINVKVKWNDKETEINGSGSLLPSDFTKVVTYFEEVLDEGDMVVIAGTFPSTIPIEAYHSLFQLIQEKKSQCVIDTSSKMILEFLQYNPVLIKPNIDELAEIFDLESIAESEVSAYVFKLQEKGAQYVLLSMGGDGAKLFTKEGKIYQSTIASGVVKGTVGAGDSMVAGFVASYLQQENEMIMLKNATACGCATAYSDGLAKKEKIEQCFQEVKVNEE